MNQREGYIPDVDELRQTADSPPVELVQFDEAEQHYLRAIELDPKLADAHVRLGYARFLQSLDKQARESYDLAKKFDPEHPMLALRYAQLEHVEGHYEKAIEGYLAVIAKPERTSGVHRRALVHSRLAFIEQGKLDDYLSLGERYLASNPDQHQYRVDLARHLLWSGATADHVLKVLDLAPAHWGPVRVIRGVSLVLKVWEVQRASGQIDAQARTWLEEAVALYGNVLSLASEMCMSPSGASAATLLVPLSNQPHDVLSQVLGCAIRHGDLDAIVAAKRLGADLDEILATWIPETPLGMAALMRKPDVFKKLLELGADPSRPMRDGRTLDEFLIQASIPPDPYPDAKHLREMLTRFQHERGAGSTE